jgi:hypothetical protein
MMPWAAAEREEAQAVLLRQLGEQTYQALLEDGRALSPDAAVAVAMRGTPDS